jgi:23S rRNA pseudouridine1911/1915/1917 synthase
LLAALLRRRLRRVSAPRKGPPVSTPAREAVQFKNDEFAVAQAMAVDRALRERYDGASWNAVRQLVRTGKVRVDGQTVTDPQAVVPAGASVRLTMSAPRIGGPEAVPRDAIVHADAHVVVVRKPAGIATVPFEDERDTLDRVVQSLLRKTARPGTSIPPLGVVQRLDKETSGLLVFSRTASAKKHLQEQLREHTVYRRYVAVVHGVAQDRVFRSWLVQDRGDGIRGSTQNPQLGREATTHVKVLEVLRGATLVECRLETGRTHQIRIHLSEAGHPLLGEKVYVRGFAGPVLPAPRVMLHAASLGFVHPHTGKDLRFDDPPPADLQTVINALRTQ